MTQADKKEPEKATPAAKKPVPTGRQAAETTQPKPTEDQLVKTAKGIFEKIKAKAHIDADKMDAFQKNWLAMPSTRKKYEHWIDAPQIAIEEMLGMTNDIIDHIQGQVTPDQSQIFKTLKEKKAELLHPTAQPAKTAAPATPAAPTAPVVPVAKTETKAKPKKTTKTVAKGKKGKK